MNKPDKELQDLIDMSGLQEKFIAAELNILPEYLSAIKAGKRSAVKKRLEVKTWLVNYIRNYMNFKFAA